MAYNQQPYNYGYYPQYQNGAVPDMLNQFKGQYQQMPQMQPNIQQVPVQPVPTQKPTSDIVWVQGEAGAKGFLVAPNNTVVLWDTENPVIYIKSADANGLPSMRVLDFTERGEKPKEEPHKCQCNGKFVTVEQFEELKGKILDLETKRDSIYMKEEKASEKEKTTKSTKKEAE